MNEIQRIVVVGCSGAGALAARMLKKLNPSLEVTIIREQEEKGLLTRCATPYVATGQVTVDASYKDDKMFVGPMPVSLEQLQEQLAIEIEADPNLRILIRAGSNVKYKTNEKIMVALAEVGANDLIYSAYEE